MASKTLRIRRVRLFSAAKMLGCVGAITGLLAAVPFALFAAVANTANDSHFSSTGDSGTFLPMDIAATSFGVGFFLMMPAFYGIIGFVGGFLYALAYNMVAGFTGGLEIDTE